MPCGCVVAVGWLPNIPATCWCISGQTCPDNFRCCDTNIEVVDQAFYLTQSQNTATRPILCCHIETEVVDQALYLTHNILTPDQPVPALTLQCQAAGRVATRIPGLKSLVGFYEKSLTGRAGFDLQSATIEADAKPLGHWDGPL